MLGLDAAASPTEAADVIIARLANPPVHSLARYFLGATFRATGVH